MRTEAADFLIPQGRNLGFVIIPFNYALLPEPSRKAMVPICIQSTDRHGNEIAPVWFEQGVAPIHDELINLAYYGAGDPWLASELTETSVHKLWRRHGTNAGETPWRRVWRQAFWEAKDMAAGDWRARRFRVISRTLEQLDREFPEKTVDPTDYATLFHQRLLIDSIERELREDGLDEMAEIADLVMRGHTWVEIGEPQKRRFYRLRKKLFGSASSC